MDGFVRHPTVRSNFTQINNWIIRAQDISAEARLLWIWLRHHREGFRINAAFIEKAMGCGAKRRRRMQRELIEAGWLELQPIRDEEGNFSARDYNLHIPPLENDSKPGDPMAGRLLGDPPKAPQTSTIKETNTTKEQEQEDRPLVGGVGSTVDGSEIGNRSVNAEIEKSGEARSGENELDRLRAIWTDACPRPAEFELISKDVRMTVPEFEALSTRLCGKSLARPPQRALVTLAFFGKDEVIRALKATAHADRPGWRYFKATLEGGSGKPRSKITAPTADERTQYEFILIKSPDKRSEEEQAIVEKVKAWRGAGGQR